MRFGNDVALRTEPPSLPAHGCIPLRPSLRGRPRHMDEDRRVSDGSPLIDDQLSDPEPLDRSESSISVRHVDLLAEVGT